MAAPGASDACEPMTATDDASTEPAYRRWATDPAGQTIYYPRGPAHCGYLVADVLLERAIRRADERFDGVSRQLRPLVPVLAAGLSYAFLSLIDSHPVMAFALFPALIAVGMIVDWRVRRPTIEPLLVGLTEVPAADPLARRRRHKLLAALLVLALVMTVVANFYDQQIAAAVAAGPTIDFYPSIGRYLFLASLSVVVSYGFFVGWKRQPESGSWTAALGIVLLLGGGIVSVFKVASIIERPEPTIVLSGDGLFCRWRVSWAEITGISLQSDKWGQHQAEVDLARGGSESCAIDGLSAGYQDVLAAMVREWEAAKARSALRRPRLAVSRTKEHPLHIASGRHRG
jgi:hypothetical protein